MDLLYNEEVSIPVQNVLLQGNLAIPDHAQGIIIFSHGSGSSRFSPRNEKVAHYLQVKGFATLLFDLLTTEEDLNYHKRFDIELLHIRLIGVTKWVQSDQITRNLSIGYFGASTGAASALTAAAALPEIKAVVSRGGRPDLAMNVLNMVKAATLLIVGGLDIDVLALNRKALDQLQCKKNLQIIDSATHLFEEHGKMDEVCTYAGEWFDLYLKENT